MVNWKLSWPGTTSMTHQIQKASYFWLGKILMMINIWIFSSLLLSHRSRELLFLTHSTKNKTYCYHLICILIMCLVLRSRTLRLGLSRPSCHDKHLGDTEYIK